MPTTQFDIVRGGIRDGKPARLEGASRGFADALAAGLISGALNRPVRGACCREKAGLL